MARLDLSSIPVLKGTGYPEPFAELVDGRSKQALGDAGGLTQFGVNLVELQPGAASSQRHWHSHEDEFVMVVSGELVLITDEMSSLSPSIEAQQARSGTLELPKFDRYLSFHCSCSANARSQCT